MMDEIKKINVSENQEGVTVKGGRRRSFVVLGIVGVLVLWLALGIVLPLVFAYRPTLNAYQKVRSGYDAMKKQDVIGASQELKKAHDELTIAQKRLQIFSFARFLPVSGSYYSDAFHLVNAGVYALDAAQIAIDAIVPYADVLGLKGQGSFVLGSAEERIQKAVETLDKVTPKIADIEVKVKLLGREMEEVNPNRYPDIGKFKARSRLTEVKDVGGKLEVFVSDAKPLVEVLPSLLGVSKERKYLVLFQNDKELRPTGGFITAYAIFRIDRGIIHVDKSEDIYALDGTLRRRQKAPDPILRYLPKVTTFNLRDSNLSPDFATSMKTFDSLYQDARGKVNVDGIIAIDTHVLVSTIKILDDKVEAGGITFTTKEDKRCNCPQVIYVLEDTISRPIGYKRVGRKDIIGSLLFAIMQKALSSSPKVYWGPLLQAALSQVGEKHILFYLYDEKAQRGLDALQATGRIKPYDGDYLHINDTNFAGAKSNMYVRHNVLQHFDVASDGSIVKTLQIEYRNPAEPSDCNLESGGLCLNAELRNWLRIYVPKGSTVVESQGSEVTIETKEEFDKTVFEGFLRVRPLGKTNFTIKYTLPFKRKGRELPLLIQKQPGTDGHDYQIKANGKEVEKFKLRTDRELRVKL